MERDQPATAEGIVLDRYLEVCSGVLKSIGNSLIDGVEMKPETEALTKLDALSEQLRKTDTARSPAQAAMTPAQAAMTKSTDKTDTGPILGTA